MILLTQVTFLGVMTMTANNLFASRAPALVPYDLASTTSTLGVRLWFGSGLFYRLFKQRHVIPPSRYNATQLSFRASVPAWRSSIPRP